VVTSTIDHLVGEVEDSLAVGQDVVLVCLGHLVDGRLPVRLTPGSRHRVVRVVDVMEP
jgi:hypothetical protein